MLLSAALWRKLSTRKLTVISIFMITFDSNNKRVERQEHNPKQYVQKWNIRQSSGWELQ